MRSIQKDKVELRGRRLRREDVCRAAILRHKYSCRVVGQLRGCSGRNERKKARRKTMQIS
jgi:hypothetical protein